MGTNSAVQTVFNRRVGREARMHRTHRASSPSRPVGRATAKQDSQLTCPLWVRQLSQPLLVRHAIERCVARFAAGRSNKTAPDELGISEKTVKTHMKSILAKLGVSNRTDAVAIATKRGILGR